MNETPEQLMEKFSPALTRLYTDPQPVEVKMSKADAWSLIAAVQLAARHPRAKTSPVLKAAIDTARQIGAALTANDRDLRMLLEMGWQPQFDENVRT